MRDRAFETIIRLQKGDGSGMRFISDRESEYRKTDLK